MSALAPKTPSGDPGAAETQPPDLPVAPPDADSSGTWAEQGASVDRFTVLREIGRGGMAVVYLARDTQSGERVALKIMRRVEGEALARFEREVKAASSVQHPGICRTVAFGSNAQSMFLAMEFIAGETLTQLGKRAPAFPAVVAAEILRQLLEALDTAHRAGIVHRDLKPPNVMLTTDGNVKLVDFGIAKSEDDATVTATGAVIGTPAFMAPEQTRSGRIDSRADLFAAGMTTWALLRKLTHRYAGQALDPAQILLRVSIEPTAPLLEDAPQTPIALDSIVAGLTAMDLERRFQTAAEALEALRTTGLLRADGPALLAAFVANPKGASQTLNVERGQAEAATGRALADEPGGHVAAALALHRATVLNPADLASAERLRALCAEHGFTFDPVSDPRLGELLEAFKQTPSNPGVLKRLSDLYRANGHVRLSAAYLWRYVRERPEDSHALQQLKVMLEGPDTHAAPSTQQRLSTRSIIAGVKTGGLPRASAQDAIPRGHRLSEPQDATRALTGAAAVPLAPRGAPQRWTQPAGRATGAQKDARTGSSRNEGTSTFAPASVIIAAPVESSGAGWGVKAAGLGVLLVCGALALKIIVGAGTAVTQHATDPARGVAPIEERATVDNLIVTLDAARTALTQGDLPRATALASEVLGKNPSISVGREALYLRGLAQGRLGDRAAALRDLELYRKNVTALDDPHLAEVNHLLADLAAGRVPGGLQ